jgi:hypothetical protein
VTTVAAAKPPATGGPRRPASLLVFLAGGLIALGLLGLLVAAIQAGHAQTHTLAAPVDGRSAATLAVVNGVGHITVHSADIGGDLYRISTPGRSAQVPTVAQRDGEFQLGFTAVGGATGTPSSVDVIVNSAVTWQLRIANGAQMVSLDLRGASISELDLASGVSAVEAWLPEPHGTLIVRETGGVDRLTLHRAARTPVRLTAAGGAGSVSIDAMQHTGVGAGEQFTLDGWTGSTNRLDIDAVGGVAQVRIDQY